MPKLIDDVWVEGGFYIDFDSLGQFRVIGPNNHLYCGFVDVPKNRVQIDTLSHQAEAEKTILHIEGRFVCDTFVEFEGKQVCDIVNFYHPAMEDIRTVRMLTFDAQGQHLSFLQIREKDPTKMAPMYAHKYEEAGETKLLFRRSYGEYWYQCIFTFNADTGVRDLTNPHLGHALINKKSVEIPFHIEVSTNDIRSKNPDPLTLETEIDFAAFGIDRQSIERFWKQTKIGIEHLINWGKTSGDNFGTIFPRDWLESLILGADDIPRNIASYMLSKSLMHVSEQGEGWHEDVIGEFEYEYELAGRDTVDRKMIDIEPLYLIALNYVSHNIWLRNDETLHKLRSVAHYVMKAAREKDFIIFKERPKKEQTPEEKYYVVGNWRDGSWSFKRIHQVIAPFDVNAVFYPQALASIAQHRVELGFEQEEINKLVEKWRGVAKLYEFSNNDELPAYALALYNTSDRTAYEQFNVNHLDESYLYLLSKDVPKDPFMSFVSRLENPNYFYTHSGPLLIEKNNKFGYTPSDYHGLVIWTKQAAFAIAGLVYQLENERLHFDTSERSHVKRIGINTCVTLIKTFCKLEAIPEVHIDQGGIPAFFMGTTDAFVMSKLQLWSAVGARRIFRDYAKLLDMQ